MSLEQRRAFTPPALVGLNATAISSAATSNGIAVSGAKEVALEIDYTWAAGTEVTWNIQTRKTPTVGNTIETTWRTVQQTIEVPDGTSTYVPRVFRFVTGGASANLFVVLRAADGIALDGQIRIRNVTAAAGTTDSISIGVWVTFGD